MQTKSTVQVTESRAHESPSGAAKEAVSCERPRSRTPSPPHPPPPPTCRVSCVQITAESPSNRRWPFLPGGSPGEDPYLRKSSLGLSRGLELRGFWSSSRPDPLAGSGAAVPAIFNILFCFAGTCCPTIIVYSCCCCCCCCCRQVASVVSDSVRPHGRQPTRLPRSLGVSRQEHRSGLPFSSPTHESEKGK